MRTGWTHAQTRRILRIWAVLGMARGVRRRSLPASKRGRCRIVLSRPSVLPPLSLSGPRGAPPASPPPLNSSRLPAVERLQPPTRRLHRHRTRMTNEQIWAVLSDHRHAVRRRAGKAADVSDSAIVRGRGRRSAPGSRRGLMPVRLLSILPHRSPRLTLRVPHGRRRTALQGGTGNSGAIHRTRLGCSRLDAP